MPGPVRKNDGIEVVLQGYICSPDFSMTRSTGTSPDFGYVLVTREVFGEFKLSTADGDDPSNLGARETRERGVVAAGDGFRPQGDLVVTERFSGEDGEQRSVSTTFVDVLVPEDAIEGVLELDDTNHLDDMVRVNLTDIRYLWQSRGIINGWFNVRAKGPVSGAAAAAGGGTSTGAAFLPGSLKEQTVVEQIQRQSGGAIRIIEPAGAGGAAGDSRPWTLEELLREIVLPALPGAPTLRRIPADVKDETPEDLIWESPDLPLDALNELLDRYSLTLALNLDNSVSLWKRKEGDKIELSVPLPSGVDFFDIQAHTKPSITFNHVPPCVVVIGPAIRQNAKATLEAVGEIGGDLRPIEEVLKELKVEVKDARKFPLAPPELRAIITKGDQETAKELERWAYKWFRIPGVGAENSDKVPIRNIGRGDSSGAFVRPFVEANSIQRCDLATASRSGNLASLLLAPAVKAANAAGIKSPSFLYTLERRQMSSGFQIDPIRGLVMFRQPPTGVTPDPALPGQGSVSASSVQLVFGYDLKPTIDGAPGLQHRYHRIFVREEGNNTPKAVDSIPEGVFVRQVVRPDLLEVRQEDGGSNKADLDAVAEKLAADIFAEPRATQGFNVRLCRPAPVLNSGSVSTITWTTQGERPAVFIRAGFSTALQAITRRPLRTFAQDIDVTSARGQVYIQDSQQKARQDG